MSILQLNGILRPAASQNPIQLQNENCWSIEEPMDRQLSLWNSLSSSEPQTKGALTGGERLDMPDGEVILYRQGFDWAESNTFFDVLNRDTQWRQDSIPFYGKVVPVPRLTAWYGDRGKSYTYSGIEMHPEPWTEALQQIKARVEAIAAVSFNSVLLNLYRHGQDSVAWHSDDEPELGANPAIASVSFGGSRRFRMKHRRRKEIPPVELDLHHGDVLLMRGSTQAHWLHQIPKTSKSVAPRINLTFRTIF